MSRLGAAFLAVLLAATGLWASSPKRRPTGPNVLLVTIDTLRADHLSCYGYSRLTSPHLDRLAEEGVRFQNAYTPIPLTGPAHISLMTSVFPQQHGATINGMSVSARPRPLSLAQILHRMGYRTAAFISGWPLKKSITGLDRGFHVYNQKFTYHFELVNAARRAEDVTAPALRWLKRKPKKRPFFLWVHYFDPHSPYDLHEEYANLPANPGVAKVHLSETHRTAEEAEKIRAYDSEVAHADRYLGDLLHELDALRIRDHTLVVVVADHGEDLGENGYFGHGDRIDQPIIHIPLIVSYPGMIPGGKVVEEDVSLLDVMPTVLDYVGLPVRIPIEGHSMKPLIEAAPTAPSRRRAFFLTYREPPLLPPKWLSWIWTWANSKMVPADLGFVNSGVKFVLEGEKRRPSAYRLDETASLETPFDLPAGEIKTYREQLTKWFDRTNRGLTPRGKLSEEDIEMLRSLGYVD
jgi:arylsulfatase A-like enzyme